MDNLSIQGVIGGGGVGYIWGSPLLKIIIYIKLKSGTSVGNILQGVANFFRGGGKRPPPKKTGLQEAL